MAADNKLDVFSDNFDALSAIYADNIVIPWKSAPVLDNVAKFEALLVKSDGCESVDQILKKDIAKIKEKKRLAAAAVAPIERNIPLPGKPKVVTDDDDEVSKLGKTVDNVLTLIEKTTGPLGFLKDCMNSRIRVKVWTRNHSQMRGFSEGFVVAFDKHWNIALQDVTEIWTRRRKQKKSPLGIESEPPPNFAPIATPPPIQVVKRKKKKEICTRHVNQLMIRGEHVVLISVISK